MDILWKEYGFSPGFFCGVVAAAGRTDAGGATPSRAERVGDEGCVGDVDTGVVPPFATTADGCGICEADGGGGG